MQVNYLIVGLGLSGIAVAENLRKKNLSFKIVADHSQRASEVAGGLINPVVLKRFKMAWNAEKHYEQVTNYYHNLEELLQTKLVQKVPIYRKFTSVEEQNNWFEASDKPGLSSFLNTNLVNEISQIQSAFKFGKVEKTALLNTAKLIESYRQFLKRESIFIEASFDHDCLKFLEGKVQYKDLRADKIVFCEGFGMANNPYFNYLPLVGNKGEYLLIIAPELKLEAILKTSVFVIPMGNNIYKVGATYDRSFTNQNPSKDAKDTLLKKLDTVLDCPFEVVGQEAAVRPTVKDRKPLVGQHPKQKNMFVCNGFGSRGILMSFPMANHLVELMENHEQLPQEIDIQRYEDLFPFAADSL